MEKIEKNLILSKHLVFEPHIFLYSKKLLSISQTFIILDTIPFKYEQRDTILFSEIKDIMISPSNEKDFSIKTVRKSLETLSFVSYDRIQLLTDLYLAINMFHHNKIKKNEEINLFIQSFSTNGDFICKLDNFNDSNTIQNCKITLFRSFIRFESEIIENLIDLEVIFSGFSPLEFNINYKDIILLMNGNKRLTFLMKSGIVIKLETNYIESIIKLLIERYELLMGKTLILKKEEDSITKKSYLTELLISQYFLIFAYRISFSQNLQKKIILGSNEHDLIELDSEKKTILQKIPLINFKSVIRKKWGLEFITNDCLKLQYIISAEKKDIILNNWLFLKNEYHEKCLFSEDPAMNLEVKGQNGEIDQDLQIELSKKTTLGKDEEEIIENLRDFNINCNCKGIRQNDSKDFQTLFQILNKLLNVYFQSEVQTLIEYHNDFSFYQNLRIELMIKGYAEEINYLENQHSTEMKLENFLQEKHKIFWENDQEIELSVEWLEKLIIRIEEILRALCIMSNCSINFREISNQKDDFFESIMFLIVNLNDSHNEVLSFLSTLLIQKLSISTVFTDRKYETLNRRLFINGKPKLLKKIVESLAYKTLFGSRNQESNYSLSLKITLQLLECFLITNKEGSSADDYDYIFEVLTSKIMITAISNLCRCESFSILYSATCIFNGIFDISINFSKNKLKEIQLIFMNQTCLLILHMFFGLANVCEKQRKASIIFFSHMLHENQAACSLLIRIIPKCLLSRVSTTQSDISKWRFAHWEELFQILKQTFNTPLEQWNESSLKELLKKLKKGDEEFFKKRRMVTEREIALNNGDINIPEHKLLSLKWNHEEFSIEYEALKTKHLVWKYYLSCLVRDKENPILTIAISQPLRLWNELTAAYASCFDPKKRNKILKAKILVYRYHYHSIREIQMIPLLINLFKREEFVDDKYLLLQLFYVAFTREDSSIVKINIKKFFDHEGLEVFLELFNGMHFGRGYDSPKSLDESISNPTETHNFTEAKFLTISAHDLVSEKINCSLFILNILDFLLNRQKAFDNFECEVFPTPIARFICLKPKNLEILVHSLLIEDETVFSNLLRIIIKYFVDRLNYQLLLQVPGFWEILLSKINEKTINDILQLTLDLYKRLRDDPEQPNYIELYIEFDFIPLDSKIQKEALNLFGFLRYFPKNMVWRLFNKGLNEFTNIFFQENFEEPDLIWTKSMKEKIMSNLQQTITPLKNSLINLSDHNFSMKIPHFQFNNIENLIHENIENEVTCGPVFLRIWNLKSQKYFSIEEDMIDKFLQLLGDKLISWTETHFEYKYFPDLLILLTTHSKAIKRYEINHYSSFGELFKILIYFSDLYNKKEIQNEEEEEENKLDKLFFTPFIIQCLRAIYRSIKLKNSGNLEEFISKKGIQTFFEAFKALVTKIFPDNKKPEFVNYYKNCLITEKDLVCLGLVLKILKFLLQNAKQEIFEIKEENQKELSMFLQKISKIGLIYCEYLKRRRNRRDLQEKSSLSKIPDHEFSKEKNLFEDLVGDMDEVDLESDIEKYEKKIFPFLSDLVQICKIFSCELSTANSLIESGILWRLLEFSLFYDESFEFGVSDFDRMQKINSISEESGLVIRNVSIFSNEIAILKNASSSTNYNEKIINTKQKSEPIFNIVSKLPRNKKEILRKYYEGLIILLQHKLTYSLLEDYYEPNEIPEEKDKRAIKNFLKMLNGNFEEEDFIWNNDIRNDLKDLIRRQISSINDEESNFFDKIHDYQYASYINELKIENIFVRIFNKKSIKLIDYGTFLKNLFYEILEKVKSLDSDINEKPLNTNITRIATGKIFIIKRLIEALKAINKILNEYEFYKVVLEKTNFDILIKLLFNADIWFKDMKSFLMTLQIEIYNIIETLTINSQEIIVLLTNKLLIHKIFKQLRSNDMTKNTVIEKVLKILQNISSQQHYFGMLEKYGVSFILLEIILKTEIVTKSNRISAFKLILKCQLEGETMDSLKYCFHMLPPEIEELIVDNMNVSDFIDLIDSEIQNPYFIWTSLMRKEIWSIFAEINEFILSQIQSFEIENNNFFDFSLNSLKEKIENIPLPQFPELINEIKIREIILRNFNRSPYFDIKVNLAIFIDEISQQANETYILFQNFICSKKEYSHEEDKKYKRTKNEFLTLLTSLLLSIEQFIYNKTNPQANFTNSSFLMVSQDESLISKEIQQQPLENSKFISEETLTNILKWIDLFQYEQLELTIRFTLLEIVYLTTEIDRGISLLKTGKSLTFLLYLFEKELNFAEEILILNIIFKMLLKDSKLVGLLLIENIKFFLNFYSNGHTKDYLEETYMNILSLLLKDLQHSEYVEELLQNITFVNLEELRLKKMNDLNCHNIWRVFKMTENLSIDIDQTIEKIVRLDPKKSIKYPFISHYAYEPLPFPEPEIEEKMSNINNFFNLEIKQE